MSTEKDFSPLNDETRELRDDELDSITGGASENPLDMNGILTTNSENPHSSESGYRDADMAKEMTESQKNNILMQAAQSMLAQATRQPQGILTPLQ